MGDGPRTHDLDGPTIPGADVSPDTVREPIAGVPGAGEVIAKRYTVERLLGTGGMGHVLLAIQRGLDRRVAIKVLDPALLSNPQALERFAREARAMAALTSPHSVRVHDVGHLESGLPYFVMEYLEGRDLAQELLARGRVPIATACDYIVQACHALEEAHAAGLVHRDLKLQNLFLSKEEGKDRIRVLDFGIARAVGGARVAKLATLTHVGDVIGTVSYMAPEQLRNPKSVEQTTDIWSLGACLHRLLTNTPPFEGETEAQLVEAILLHPPRPPHELRVDVPREVEEVVRRCLQKTPADRYPNAAALRAALFAAVNDRTAPIPRLVEPLAAQKTAPLQKPLIDIPSPPPTPTPDRPWQPAPTPRGLVSTKRGQLPPRTRRGGPSALHLVVIVVLAALLVVGGGFVVLFVLGDR